MLAMAVGLLLVARGKGDSASLRVWGCSAMRPAKASA
jgi:hypothetical protein